MENAPVKVVKIGSREYLKTVRFAIPVDSIDEIDLENATIGTNQGNTYCISTEMKEAFEEYINNL